MQKEKAPLYRKVNKTTVCRSTHDTIKNPDSKYDRGRKGGIKRGMKPVHNTGYDYTPLFKFLFSKVGKDWNTIHSEAIKRLDKEEPLFYIVARNESEKRESVRVGEASYYSGLYIDDDNILQIVNPDLKNEDLHPSCYCCTNSFNGKVLINKTPQW